MIIRIVLLDKVIDLSFVVNDDVQGLRRLQKMKDFLRLFTNFPQIEILRVSGKNLKTVTRALLNKHIPRVLVKNVEHSLQHEVRPKCEPACLFDICAITVPKFYQNSTKVNKVHS